ncbi:MAG TPA: galactokinase [Bacteroidota bacterium]|nr:galactokinase [Bacteroidota bacterium]
MTLIEAVEKKFKDTFPQKPLLVRSPGRVNLIGEHTDYNLGFVLPAAIEKAVYFAIAPRTDTHCQIVSLDMNDAIDFEITALARSDKGWPNYLMGVVDQLCRAGYAIKGFNCVFGGDIPIGAGLSSSAAIEAGLAYALNSIFNLGISKLDLVKMAQKAENEFVGVQCGIMDQYINIFGAEHRVLKIDCRSLAYEYVPFQARTVSILLLDTCVSHSLASSEYNQRRRECAEGVRLLRTKYDAIQSLRDATLDQVREFKDRMGDVVYRRCKFVVEENERLLKGCDALRAGDVASFGELMRQAHTGLSKEYEVSCDELDFLVELAADRPGVYGSRMMGGGFGGCTINLIETDAVTEFSAVAAEAFTAKFGHAPKSYVTTISAGTHSVPMEDANDTI